jgi:hypothetical protein
MIPGGQAPLTKEFFYRKPKQYSFNKEATLPPGGKGLLTFFAPVNRAQVITNNLHYFKGVSIIQI